MARRLLVVITSPVADDVLRDLVRSRAGDEAQMLVVAPASDIPRLDWLTNAEDDARAQPIEVLCPAGFGEGPITNDGTETRGPIKSVKRSGAR